MIGQRGEIQLTDLVVSCGGQNVVHNRNQFPLSVDYSCTYLKISQFSVNLSPEVEVN